MSFEAISSQRPRNRDGKTQGSSPGCQPGGPAECVKRPAKVFVERPAGVRDLLLVLKQPQPLFLSQLGFTLPLAVWPCCLWVQKAAVPEDPGFSLQVLTAEGAEGYIPNVCEGAQCDFASIPMEPSTWLFSKDSACGTMTLCS